MSWDAKKIWFKINCTSHNAKLGTERNLEKHSVLCNKISPQIWQNATAKDISWFIINSRQKKGNGIGYDGFERITVTKIHVAVEQNGLPISIVIGSANQHDSTRFVDVMEDISDYLDDESTGQIVAVYADKGIMPISLENTWKQEYDRLHSV